MADFFLPDDIICNIISRLPAKPLLRFRCVSRYWNSRLREPNFMKLRSRKMIILPLRDTFNLIDATVPSDDTSNMIVERFHPFNTGLYRLTVVGTFNGVVLLAWQEYFILYNPFTRVHRRLPRPPSGFDKDGRGFGHGATPDDLKIVRFRQRSYTCDVYNFREGSWSTLKYNIYIDFEHSLGHFVNGFLYWIALGRSVLIAINVKDMVLSEISLPFNIGIGLWSAPLGTMDGYLCSVQPITNSGFFDVWVMKEGNQWSKIYSFKLVGLLLHDIYPYYVVCILDGRRVLMWNPTSEDLLIYDTSKGSYKTLNKSVGCRSVLGMRPLEYVETLVSPSHMCSSSFEGRRKCKR